MALEKKLVQSIPLTLNYVLADKETLERIYRQIIKQCFMKVLIGGIIFTISFSDLTWFLYPNSPQFIFIFIAAISSLYSVFAGLLDGIEGRKWYREKDAEINSIEFRLRAGETVFKTYTNYTIHQMNMLGCALT